jgi:hypothetical protein
MPENDDDIQDGEIDTNRSILLKIQIVASKPVRSSRGLSQMIDERTLSHIQS